ncbi:MAG: hypothetical protein COU08_00760 [Candidatus Harrisonbacteria bacterium CG10_big_fil_rev_8_21_14_0_10_42_17]|uniref:EF-hand domain-containing protein n=1 Tax=Candidatus Harrisonbacteria bacterium CG10_big_fil_rev_8_21_14_0_10_42_17 TaxID=1974584 RepID=A0A2M6WJ16_9BACT|nr:MAG: hypothetical protein COU08_00760 [Candidatus Harrisonbacteria bacterium CG10_big_fil_rev_8_21_14_0_10_42_17]
MNFRALLISLLVFLFLARPVFADDFSSTNFTVKDPILSGGGGYATSSSFLLWSSFAQPAIGLGTSTSFGVQSGFLYFPAPASSPSPSPSPFPSPSPSPPSSGQGTIPASPFYPPIQQPLLPPFVLLPPFFQPSFDVAINCVGGRGRSDFNCDGKIDLRDLSIVLAQPQRPLLRLFSILFSDWTQQFPAFVTNNPPLIHEEPSEFIPEKDAQNSDIDNRGVLAQLESTVEQSQISSDLLPQNRGFWGKFIDGVKLFASWFRRILF